MGLSGRRIAAALRDVADLIEHNRIEIGGCRHKGGQDQKNGKYKSSHGIQEREFEGSRKALFAARCGIGAFLGGLCRVLGNRVDQA
jgi:hypothetical protein